MIHFPYLVQNIDENVRKPILLNNYDEDDTIVNCKKKEFFNKPNDSKESQKERAPPSNFNSAEQMWLIKFAQKLHYI